MIPLRLPDPEKKAAIMSFAASRESMSDEEKGGYGTTLAAKCLAATVVTDQEMSEDDWARLVIASDAEVDGLEEMADVVSTAMRACGSTATTRSKVKDNIEETDKAIGDLPTE